MRQGYIIILSFILLTCFYGCIDDPIQQNGFVIKGNLYYGEDYFVSISGGQVVECGEFGDFEIAVNSKPYDLFICDKYYWLYNLLIVKYSGITINSPQLVYAVDFDFWYHGSYPSWEPCSADIYFPEITEKKLIAVKLLSEDTNYHLYYFRNFFPGSNIMNLDVFIPPEKNSISGKLYYLECNVDSGNWGLISYDKFGIKDVTLHKGTNPDIYFDSSELTDPPEYNIVYNVNLPPGLSCGRSEIYLTGSALNKGSDLLLSAQKPGHGNITIPLLNGNDFKIRFCYDYRNDNFQSSKGIANRKRRQH